MTQSVKKLSYENQGYIDRLQRAESWIAKAKAIEDWEDHHGQFIFYWIAFNAMYGRDKESRRTEDNDRRWFLSRLCDLDSQAGEIHSAVHALKSKGDRLIMDQYLIGPFWDQGWTPHVKRVLEQDFKTAQTAWAKGDVAGYLEVLLGRISVLRNQVFHGCSTDRRSLNLNSLLPSIRILEVLVPLFLQTMQRHGSRCDWPKIPYPRKDSPQHPRS